MAAGVTSISSRYLSLSSDVIKGSWVDLLCPVNLSTLIACPRMKPEMSLHQFQAFDHQRWASRLPAQTALAAPRR